MLLGRPSPPTHEALPPDRLMALVRALEAEVDRSTWTIDEALLERVAEAEEVPVEQLYAAAAVHPRFEFARAEKTTFVVCAGGCQAYGSLPVIERLHALRKTRRDEGKPSFDLHSKRCLDQCHSSPFVVVELPDGQRGGLPKATPDLVAEVVGQVLDG